MGGSNRRGLRLAAGASALLGIGVAVVWVLLGAHFTTQYQVAETRKVQDEFGDAVEQTVLVDAFRFGLMPDRGLDGALPWMGLTGALTLVLLWRAGRRDGPGAVEP